MWCSDDRSKIVQEKIALCILRIPAEIIDIWYTNVNGNKQFETGVGPVRK